MTPSDEPIALEGPAEPPEAQKRMVRAGAPVKAGAPVAGLIPRTIEEAWRLAVAIAKSRLAPKGMERPEQVLIAIMGGAEVGLPPFQALQSFAVVNGRPTMWGDGLLAVVLARGVKVKEWYEGEGDELVAWCTVTRPDSAEEPTTRWFSIDDAKTAKLWNKRGSQGQDTPWITYPRRMLQMRARSWALRDGCADMLRGIQIREEVADYDDDVVVTDVTPTVSQFLTADVEIDDGEIEIVEIDDPQAAAAGEVLKAGADATAGAEPATEGPAAATGVTVEPEQVEVRGRRSALKEPPQGAGSDGE